MLTEVKVEFDGFDAYDVEPKVLPDVFANRPVVVFGKYKGTPSGKVTIMLWLPAFSRKAVAVVNLWNRFT